ncbi:hypothetical protein HELRODRAFT_155397 [Helobdella robusta]|uniref:N(4)-(beta-N-acetylglucosaminyl)-L-asparaginase n=1 Tax=Helobdella robusta TaxID=6412 RepID=T1ELI2_HELRO|nr:hypothetical protein HELRODRAFT_155397 [Helobdella robusta]ESN92060.1 hypothetical protein HELRODRAFT_155397 [Helobdella robusta]
MASKCSGRSIIATTWNEPFSTNEAWRVLKSTDDPIEAVVEGCSYSERIQSRGTVGYGGSPDENGETTLDAMVMDGLTLDVGCVGALREIKDVTKVAKMVLKHTEHSLLVGELATDFAVKMGFKRETLQTEKSLEMWRKWKDEQNRLPNFWKNLPADQQKRAAANLADSHDTITMIAMNQLGRVAVGCSTNGLKHKIPGRVGDSPIPGSGAYADDEVGGAGATGNGDILMRFLPSFHMVELMRNGMKPSEAAEHVMKRMKKHYPEARGAVLGLSISGEFGAACTGYECFEFVVRRENDEDSVLYKVPCI